MQTINEYIKSLPTNMKTREGKTLRDTMLEITPIWSNEMCKGYVIDAMERAEIDDTTKQKILNALYDSFNFTSYEQAEAKGK